MGFFICKAKSNSIMARNFEMDENVKIVVRYLRSYLLTGLYFLFSDFYETEQAESL